MDEHSSAYVGRKVRGWLFLFLAWVVKTRDPGR
jgi:hypothetical protein